MSFYEHAIAESLHDQGLPAHPPRLIEAWMRVELGTLDALTRDRFDEEVRIGADCVARDLESSEKLAWSYGLFE